MTEMIFNPHVAPGILALAVTVFILAWKYLRAQKRGRFRWWGWAGLALILVTEFLNSRGVAWVGTYFTPLAWTGYLLLVDSMVCSLKGQSLLSSRPGRFFSLAFWSVPLWLIFEAYNLRLQNWKYVGLPENPVLLYLGYFWSFATIWPAIFETAELVGALGMSKKESSVKRAVKPSTLWALLICGAALVVLPLAAPVGIAQYLFGAVWIGFILLLDPLNYRWNGFSFLRKFEAGEDSAFWSFVAAGWICGILWEFWNYWAAAKWLYIFPIGQSSKVFEMPLAGFLGFLPFALECKVMFEFIQNLKARTGRTHLSDWDVARSHGA
jgi:hypothetical protein